MVTRGLGSTGLHEIGIRRSSGILALHRSRGDRALRKHGDHFLTKRRNIIRLPAADPVSVPHHFPVYLRASRIFDIVPQRGPTR